MRRCGEGEIGLGGAIVMGFDADRRRTRWLQLDQRRSRQHGEADGERQRELAARRRGVEPGLAAVENEEPFGHDALLRSALALNYGLDLRASACRAFDSRRGGRLV